MTALIFERRAGWIALVALALCLGGCADERNAVAPGPIPEPMPWPRTPAMAVRAFEWCWDHQSVDGYRQLFSADFSGACAATDSAGNVFRARALTRFDELETARHVFVGGGAQPPANNITLQLDPNLIVEPDPRPGREDASLYRTIETRIVLRIDTFASDFQIVGVTRFFLVRGDVAVIPDDLVAQGVRPDAGRWYIQRWEDESVGTSAPAVRAHNAPGEAFRTMPAKNATWCSIKALYR